MLVGVDRPWRSKVGTRDACEGNRDSGEALVAALGHELGGDWHSGGTGAEHNGVGLLQAAVGSARA